METQLETPLRLKPARSKPKGSAVEARHRLTWIAFLIPALAIYVLFMAIPLLGSIRLSLYTGAGIVPKTFVGLGNFQTLFTHPVWSARLANALGNTFVLFLIHMGVQNTLGLLFAVLLTNKIRGRNFYRTVIFLPATLSVLVIGFLWRLILNPQWGAIPLLLTAVGLKSWVHPWLGDVRYALIVISLVSCWQWVGLPTMMYLAALIGIPEEFDEAARVDGANAWTSFKNITLPLMVPVTVLVAILTVLGTMQSFVLIQGLVGGEFGGYTSVPVLRILANLIGAPRFGYACSQGIVFGFILIIISFIQYIFSRKFRQA